MLWFFALLVAAPLGDRVELFAGEQWAFTAPCSGAEVTASTKRLSATVKGLHVQLGATVPGEGELRVRCEDSERRVHVRIKPLPDLFDGQPPGDLPPLPDRLVLHAGERRAFNPVCSVSGMSGEGRAATAELSLIRVVIVSAEEVGASVITVTCGSRAKRVDVAVLP